MSEPLLTKKDFQLFFLYLNSCCHTKDTPENYSQNNSGDIDNQTLIPLEEVKVIDQ